MSLRSRVSTVPPGSAKATTVASTAEPRPAWARKAPALRASPSGRSSMMTQVLRNRSTIVSVRGCPDSDSTRTIEGTTGGQIPSFLNAVTSDAAFRSRSDRRLTAPESRTKRFIPLRSQALGRGRGARELRLGPSSRLRARQAPQTVRPGSGRSLLAPPVGASRPGRPSAAAWRWATAAPSRPDTDHQEDAHATVAYHHNIHSPAACQPLIRTGWGPGGLLTGWRSGGIDWSVVTAGGRRCASTGARPSRTAGPGTTSPASSGGSVRTFRCPTTGGCN